MVLSLCDLTGLLLLAEEDDDRSDLSRMGNSLVEMIGPTGLREPEDILCASLDAVREIC
jgi:hypothetical protein